MASFLLFVFVFASQVIGGFNTKLPPPSYGNTITILSIDGGGIKGIIPSVVLQHLEKALKKKDEKAVLADYFDVIAGTSTGGLITTMLATPHPNDTSRPVLSPTEIIQFYLDNGGSIFNQTAANESGWNQDSMRPKFDGKFLHNIANELAQETRLHQTLTNVVIPTFDIKTVHPVIFSSFKVKKAPSLDAKMADIAIGTSALPSQLPPYYFKNGDTDFNLVDGGLAAASPALVAVSEVIQELNTKNPNFIPVNPNEPTKLVLLSLGCGRTGGTPTTSVDAWKASFIPAKLWLPIAFADSAGAVGDMNEYHLESVFPEESSDNYYLRIEEYNLDPSIAGGDNTSKEGMEELVKAGHDLLEQPVKTMDVISFVPHEKPNGGTNAEALERLAEILYKEKQLRLKMKSMEKKGRPFIQAITSPHRMSGMF